MSAAEVNYRRKQRGSVNSHNTAIKLLIVLFSIQILTLRLTQPYQPTYSILDIGCEGKLQKHVLTV